MKREMPRDLDPEFDVLPSVYDKRDATDLKFIHDTNRAAATRHRRWRNGLGAASLLLFGAGTLAHQVEDVDFSNAAVYVDVAAVTLLASEALSKHRQAGRETQKAELFGGYVAEIFKRAELTPPEWAVEQITRQPD